LPTVKPKLRCGVAQLASGSNATLSGALFSATLQSTVPFAFRRMMRVS
jgi:hypothetical protein